MINQQTLDNKVKEAILSNQKLYKGSNESSNVIVVNDKREAEKQEGSASTGRMSPHKPKQRVYLRRGSKPQLTFMSIDYKERKLESMEPNPKELHSLIMKKELTKFDKHFYSLKEKPEKILNIQDENGHTLIHLACLNNDLETIQFLLEHGATKKNFLVEDKFGLTPLFFVLYHFNKSNDSTVLSTILMNSFDIDENCINDSTLLHFAAYNGNFELCRTLILMGADVNAVENEGNTPLHYACMKHHSEIVDLLLQMEAIQNSNNKGETPLMLANLHRNTNIINLLNNDKQNKSGSKRNSPITTTPTTSSSFTSLVSPTRQRNISVEMDIKNENETTFLMRSRSDLLNTKRELNKRNPSPDALLLVLRGLQKSPSLRKKEIGRLQRTQSLMSLDDIQTIRDELKNKKGKHRGSLNVHHVKI